MHILHLKPANKAWWRRQGCCQGRQGRHATSARTPSERWQGCQATPARMPTLFSDTASATGSDEPALTVQRVGNWPGCAA